MYTRSEQRRINIQQGKPMNEGLTDVHEFTCIADVEREYQIRYGVDIKTEFIDLGYRITVSSRKLPLKINGIVNYENVNDAGMMLVEHLIKDMCRQIEDAEGDK